MKKRSTRLFAMVAFLITIGAVGAMQYSFVDTDAWTVSAAADDVSTSVFGQFLKQTRYQP